MFVALLETVILTIKITLQTFCPYEHHLQTIFMEWHPIPHMLRGYCDVFREYLSVFQLYVSSNFNRSSGVYDEIIDYRPLSVGQRPSHQNIDIVSRINTLFFLYCISSDFSDLPDMTDEYIDVSVYALTGLLLYILYLTYIQQRNV